MTIGNEDIDGLGIQEVARQLGVHEQTLRRWIWRGKVKATRSQVGRSYRWLVSTDSDSPEAVARVAELRQTETALVDEQDSFESAVNRAAVSQRERLSAIEEQVEKEIRRLNAQAVAIQAEIGRLSHTLDVLRSDEEP